MRHKTQARDLLGIGEENMMELDEGTLRQYFADSQVKVILFKSKTSGRMCLKACNPTEKSKVDVREIHEAYQTMTSFIR